MTGSPSPGHLSDEQLAGYIDETLSNGERSAVESHSADCAICRAELVAATRLAATAPRPARRHVSIAAVAASAAAVLVILVAQGRSSASRQTSLRANQSPPASDASTLGVVSPRPGDEVPAGRVAFVWRRSDAAIEYTITVQDTDGRVLWSGRTTDTSVALPDSVLTASGAVLHWYVDALRIDGGTVGTGRHQVVVR